jgi:HAMP domain-containing protein
MNRLKLWLFVLLLLGAGAGNLYFLTGWLTARSVAHIDRELRSAAAVAEARIRLLGASAESIASAAARAPAVVAAMADPAASPLGPAEDAAAAAQAATSGNGAGAGVGLVAVAGAQGRSARAGGSSGDTVVLPEAVLVEAQAGRRAQAWVRLNGTLWIVAAVPSGRNGAVAVGLPLDEEFARRLHAATGVDVTSALDGKVSATTASASEAEILATVQSASAASRRPVDIGQLGKIKAALDWPTPAMPILFASPPAARALALQFDGAGPATLVLSLHTEPFFSSLATYQVLALAALALLLLVGILLGLFMTETSGRGLPRELVATAERIARGDFSARAPALAGGAGKIASALNRAADAAQRAEPRLANPELRSSAPVEAPAAPAAPIASPGLDDLGLGLGVAQPPAPAASASASEDRPLEAPRWTESLAGPEPLAEAAPEVTETSFAPRAGGNLEAAEDEQRHSEAASAGEASPVAAPLPDSAPSPARSPAHDDEDEPHWRSVYANFVRLRGETGEPASSLSFDRFRARLERNREQLKEKHAARTVRFHPYLKDGKVALRATPVK